ncbi:MAG: hypothetical protein K2F91_05910 [Muribaculaceae bacterium]|nr:hypothetical protein [Muribaculaceae bacterium]
MTPRAILAGVAAMMIVAACGRHSDDATPRRYAYPRVETPAASRMEVSAGGIRTDVSTSATVTHPGENWLDAAYPAYGATLHLSSVTLPDSNSLAEALANRRQRISLNTGGRRTRTDSFTNDAGFCCEMITADDGATATPVQFIATDSRHNLVSGAIVLHGSTEPADSIRPVTEILKDEAFRILNSIAPR